MDRTGGRDGLGGKPSGAQLIADSKAADLLLPSVALFVLVALPLLCVKVPTTADYVNHLARNYIIAFGADDPLLFTFYTIQWKLVPNLAMDLIVPPLAHLVGISPPASCSSSTMALIFTGPQAFHRALFRRFSLGPLIAGLFIYNGANRDGVVNYLLGVGVSLWSVAALDRVAPGRPHAGSGLAGLVELLSRQAAGTGVQYDSRRTDALGWRLGDAECRWAPAFFEKQRGPGV
jgi:hypothetical protein